VDDADAIVAGVGNFDVSKWLAVVPYPYTREDALVLIARLHAENRLVWGLIDEHGLRGCIGIEEELGYWLARPAWGRGYAFEAAVAVSAHWFADARAGPLESGYFDGNARSAAILSALGFRRVGSGPRHARSLAQYVPATDVRLTRADWAARLDFSLTTDRLTLRPLRETDATAISRLGAPEVTRNTGSLETGWSEDGARGWIARRLWTGQMGFMLAVEREGKVIGAVGAGGVPVSAMFVLDPAHWGQGLATEAMRTFLPALFRRFPLSRIVAERFDDNPASGRVLEKLGFVETGRGAATSKGRLEPAPSITYAIHRDQSGVSA
jgi:RimJ/RimL family protein N-acetyltransferase